MDNVGVTIGTVEADTCVEVTRAGVPDTSEAGPVLVGEVVFVASQKLVNWLNWSSRYERSVILLLAPYWSIQLLQPSRSCV